MDWNTIGSGIFRWIHVFVGIMWIGLLYFFNFVNVDAMKAANAANEGAPITKHIMPRALFFFRYAAALTWLVGAGLLSTYTASNGHNGFVAAFLLQGEYAPIGIGAWLGTIMLINVWGPIWRNQKRLLGFAPITEEEKPHARRVAFLASRVNTMLSIPMLFFMVTGPHQSIYH